MKMSHWTNTKVCSKNPEERVQTRAIFKVTGKTLSEVDLYEYLGVNIDINFNFRPLHKKLTLLVQSKLSHFRKIRYYITKKVAIQIYECTLLPVLEYADSIWEHIWEKGPISNFSI